MTVGKIRTLVYTFTSAPVVYKCVCFLHFAAIVYNILACSRVDLGLAVTMVP